MKAIQAHEILKWIKESEHGRTLEELKNWAISHAGTNSVFQTNNRQINTLNELLEYFVSIKKLMVRNGFLTINPCKTLVF